MFKKISLIFILTLAAMLLLVSCQRAASQAPLTSLATPTRTIQPTGMGQVQLIGTTQMIQTMTAVYKQTHAITPGVSQPTSTLVGTPNTFTLVPPTGVATTPAPGITPVVIVATATPGRPATYTLMTGEFVYCVARRFNVNQDELLSLNGLTINSANQVQPGVVLHIPQSGNPFVGDRALHPHPAQYTVVVNDNIYAIACFFGDIDPTAIAAANGLTLTTPLTTGRVLNIP